VNWASALRLNRLRVRLAVVVTALWVASVLPVVAQDDRRLFAGALIGVSALSADARSVSAPEQTAASLYTPENGVALNVFAGIHLAQYFSVQMNYMGNRNDLVLVSSVVAPERGGFYEQHRPSTQHSLVADALIYFRPLRSAVRPYLGAGLSVLRFTSQTVTSSVSNGLETPQRDIASTRIALRTAVGIDISVSRRVSIRYSFSETISGNPISPHLSPPGQAGLNNYQNLFGLVSRF
jgi:opacity protein-like surface antigen